MAGIPDDRSADGRRSAQASACAAAAAKRNYRDVLLNGRTRLRKECTEQTEITGQTEEGLERSLVIHDYSATSVSSVLSLCPPNPLTQYHRANTTGEAQVTQKPNLTPSSNWRAAPALLACRKYGDPSTPL